jgi:hypothetical protein
MFKAKFLSVILFLALIFNSNFIFANDLPKIKGLKVGMSKVKLLKKFKSDKIRTFRYEDEHKQYITFDHVINGKNDMFSVYLEDEKVIKWVVDDRPEVVKEYLEEFASGGLLGNPKTRVALVKALEDLPKLVFLEITKRSRPVIFIDYYTVGIAKYASSLEFRMRKEDPPTFTDGFFMIKLGDALNEADNPEPIEGIILHEIAHRVLEHLRQSKFSCQYEREANQLLKTWGYEDLFAQASKTFGAKKKGDSPCADEIFEEKEKETSTSDS